MKRVLGVEEPNRTTVIKGGGNEEDEYLTCAIRMYALVMHTYPVVHIQQEAPPTLADKIWYNTLSSFMMWMECLQNSAGNRLITGAVPMKLEFYLANELDTYTIIKRGEGVGMSFKE